MIPDLKQFDGQRPSTILHSLQEQGYEVAGSGHDSVTLAKPGADFIIRMTCFDHQAAAFVRLCEEQAGNPHLPKIHAWHRSDTDPPVFLTAMERLRTLDEIPQDVKSVIGGFGRAIATIISGHETHDDVHRGMLQDRDVHDAVFGMIDAMEDYLVNKKNGDFLYYDSGFYEIRDGASIDDWYPDDILFRSKGNSWQPVFADPFREGFLRDDAHREEIRQALQTRRIELLDLAQQKKGPAAEAAPGLAL